MQSTRLSLCIQHNIGLLQQVRLNLLEVGAQGVQAARTAALGCGAWCMAHHLGNGASGYADSLVQQCEGTAQALLLAKNHHPGRALAPVAC